MSKEIINLINVAAQAPEAPANWLVHTGNYDWSIVDNSGALVPNISVQSIRGDLSLTLTGNGTGSVAVQRRAGIQITDSVQQEQFCQLGHIRFEV